MIDLKTAIAKSEKISLHRINLEVSMNIETFGFLIGNRNVIVVPCLP